MRALLIRFGGPALVAALVGCVPGQEPFVPRDAGGGDTSAGPTYTKDVKPILAAKCVPCHAGTGGPETMQGHHAIVANYADALKDVDSTMYDVCWHDPPYFMMPFKVGECAAILANMGLMPYAMGCDQRPTQAVCLTPAEKAVLTAWADDGMPQ